MQLGVKRWSGDGNQRDLRRVENKGLEVLEKPRGRGGGEGQRGKDGDTMARGWDMGSDRRNGEHVGDDKVLGVCGRKALCTSGEQGTRSLEAGEEGGQAVLLNLTPPSTGWAWRG